MRCCRAGQALTHLQCCGAAATVATVGLFFDDFEFNPELFELKRAGQPVAMEPQVFDVLRYLIEHRDRIVPKEELLDEVWGDRFVSETALTSRIKHARRVLGDNGTTQRLIQTVRGRGYRFVAEVQPAPATSNTPHRDPDAEPVNEPPAGVRTMPDDAALPSGTVTFLFTDIEGSTRLWEQHPHEMRGSLERHDELLRSSIERFGGFVFSRAGDAFAAAFSGVDKAIEASIDAQRALASEAWPALSQIRVRMGLHVGEVHERNRDYFGPALNKAARLMASAHGGQTVASSAAAAVSGGTNLLDLGEHRLKDLAASERIFQIGAESFPPLRTLKAVRHNLPVERTTMVGRDADIRLVGGLVRNHRLVTLLGIGGTGKTRLAAAVAADQANQYTDGVWFVDLVPAGTSHEVVEAIASAAGLQLDESDVVSALGTLIADRKMLVVLDNCEHITNDVADVVDALLERTNSVHWLATSREPLQLPDERHMHVSPLAVDDDVSSPAIQLFTAAAERVGAEVEVGDVAIVGDICRHLDGLPLSIELAAAQLRHLSLDKLSKRLDQRFEILARNRGGRLRRQASLQAVLEDTWEMLAPQEQTLLLQLAAFPSGFSVDDVEAISTGLGSSVPTRTLAGLVDRSLVSDSGNRHRLLETVKLFARQTWSSAPDPDAFLERHTTWILDHLNSNEPQDWYTSFELLSWVRDHYEDHRAVEDRLAQAGRTADLAALFRALTLNYQFESGVRSTALIERIERHLTELDLSDAERGHLNATASTAGLPARRPDWIARGSRVALTFLRSHGTPEELGNALITASWMTVFEDTDDAIAMLEEAYDIAEGTGAHALADAATGYLVAYHSLAGRAGKALLLLDELERRTDGRTFDYAANLFEIFRMAVYVVADPLVAGDATTALRIGMATFIDDSGAGWGLPILCSVTIGSSGDIEGTRVAVAEAELGMRRVSSDNGLPDLLLPAAALAWRLGHTANARRWLTAIRHSAKPTLHMFLTIMYRELRGEVGLDDENPLDALSIEEIYDESVAWMGTLSSSTR